jgi:hypothetical protein
VQGLAGVCLSLCLVGRALLMVEALPFPPGALLCLVNLLSQHFLVSVLRAAGRHVGRLRFSRSSSKGSLVAGYHQCGSVGILVTCG